MKSAVNDETILATLKGLNVSHYSIMKGLFNNTSLNKKAAELSVLAYSYCRLGPKFQRGFLSRYMREQDNRLFSGGHPAIN